MLDILLSRLKEEIAIDGEEGTNITTLWTYTNNIVKDLTKSVSQKDPTIDDKYKTFLWPHLKTLDSIEFFTSDNSETTELVIAAKKPSTKRNKKKRRADSDEEFDEECLSDNEEEENEKLRSNSEKNANYIRIDIQDKSYHQLIESYGENVYAVASKELQEEQIYKNVPPVTIPSAKQLEALQVILRQRAKGLYQADLPKILNVDQKAVGHYAKSLEERGAIFRSPVSLKGIHTNLCKHVRFKTNDGPDYADTSQQTPYNVNIKGELINQKRILETIVDLCKGVSNNMLITSDVRLALGLDSDNTGVKKWFNRSLDELAIKGYIKKGYTKPDKTEVMVTCIEVLEDAFSDSPNEVQNLKNSYPVMISGDKMNELGLCMDITIGRQIFNIIEKSGVNGSSHKELARSLSCDARRVLFKLLERLIDTSSELYPSLDLKRHFEFQGRRRQFRYFTYQNYHTLIEKKDIALIPFPETEWDETRLNEVDVLKPVIRTRKQIREDNSEFVSTYYQNLIANKRKKPVKNQEAEYDDVSISEKKVTQSNVRPQKKPKTQNSENESVKLNNSEQPKINKRGRPRKHPRKEESNNQLSQPSQSANNKKSSKRIGRPPKISKKEEAGDEEMNSDIPPMNKKHLSTRQTRSRSRSQSGNSLNKESPISKHETPDTEVGTLPGNDIVPDSSEINEPCEKTTSLQTQREDRITPEIFNKSQVLTKNKQPTGKNKRQIKKAGSLEMKEEPKSSTKKRTIFDYFGKTAKKQRITPVPAENNPKSDSPTDINKDTPECSDDVISLDETTPDTEAVSDHMEDVEIELQTAQTKIIIEDDEEILVAEAGPSQALLSRYNQQLISGISESKDEVESTDAASLNASKPSKSDDTTNTTAIINNSAIVLEHTDTNCITTTNSSADTPDDTNNTTDTTNNLTSPSTTTTATTTATATTSYSKRKPPVNSYSELRKTVLLDVLERDGITEVSKDMRTKFEEAYERIVGKKPTGTICLKTLWKTCLDLSKNGEAYTKILDCSTLSGKKTIRKLLIRKDIDLDGESFKDRVEQIRATRAVMRPVNPATRFETYDAPIESVQDRITRLKEEVLGKSDISQTKASKIVAKLSEYANNVSSSVTGQLFFKHGRDAEPKRNFEMVTAINHGWLIGPMLRVKCLYGYLFDLLNQPARIQGVDKERRTISLHAFVYNLPCSIFFKVICIIHWTDELKAYVDNPENAAKTYEDFPPSIREGFFSPRNKFSQTIRKLMIILRFLGLVVPCVKNSVQNQGNSFAESYELPKNVEFWDYRVKEEFSCKSSHVLNTKEDVDIYWKELQYLSLQSQPDDKNKLASWPPHVKKQVIVPLFRMQNWDNKTLFTRTQRTLLSSYVNKHKNYTPISNLSLCRKIALEADCTVNAVRAYYSKIQTVLDKKIEDKNARRLAKGEALRFRKRGTRRSKVPRIISQQTTHIFGDKRRNRQASERDSLSNGKNDSSFTDSTDDIPVLDNKTDLKIKRAKRCIWTKQRDDLLIYSYIILQHRADRNRFMWFAIRQVLPGVKGGSCRSRLAKLILNPSIKEHMSKCQLLWKNVYSQGIQSGEIEDEKPDDMMNFNLVSYLEYFIKKIKSDLDEVHDISPLPASVAIIQDNYNITRNTNFKENVFLEAVYHKKCTSVSKLQTMYSQSYLIRLWLNDVPDYPTLAVEAEDDLDTRKVKLIVMYCVMILMTPKESYDPFLAYKTLGLFDETLFKRALISLHAIGFTTLKKVSRVVPGTNHSLSAKFLQKMDSIYPKHMFEQAKEYEKFLRQAGRTQVNPYTISSGMMACVMDLISRNKVHFTMVNSEKQNALIEFTNAARMIDPSVIAYDICIKADLSLSQAGPMNDIKDYYVFPLQMNIFDRILSAAILSLPKAQKQLTQDIVAYMKQRGSTGSVAYELRDHFKNHKEVDIQNCLDSLLQADPPLVCLVGINAERYVLTISKYIQSWTIFKDASTAFKNTEKPLFQDLIAIVPAIWTDINGNTIPVVFNDCCQTIISWIINKPGITMGSLSRFLGNFMTRGELTRILKHLIEQKVIRSISVCQESNGRNGLFAKTRLSQVTKSPRFRRNVETSYFVLPGYYNKVSI